MAILNIDVSSLVRAKIEKAGPVTIKDFMGYVSKMQNKYFSPKTAKKHTFKYILERIVPSQTFSYCVTSVNKPS